jgi:hypothetical protein
MERLKDDVKFIATLLNDILDLHRGSRGNAMRRALTAR